MTRKKKSRKVGSLGPSQAPRQKKAEMDAQSKRPKKHKGRPAGSRNAEQSTASSAKHDPAAKDPRHGSKRAIDLTPAENRSIFLTSNHRSN